MRVSGVVIQDFAYKESKILPAVDKQRLSEKCIRKCKGKDKFVCVLSMKEYGVSGGNTPLIL